jgi:hypothetical protein
MIDLPWTRGIQKLYAIVSNASGHACTTRSLGISYRRSVQDAVVTSVGGHVYSNTLTASADADHAGAKDRRSVGGWALMLNGAAVTWSSKYMQTFPTPITQDNNACIFLVKGSGMYNRAKHIDTRVYRIRELSESGEVKIYKVAGENKPADIFKSPRRFRVSFNH